MQNSRRLRSSLLFACALLVAAAVSLGLASYIKSPAQRVAETAPPPRTDLTAVVKDGHLRHQSTLSGRIEWATKIRVAPSSRPGRLNVVTSLPLKAGARIAAGQTLIGIADRPVILLTGRIPLIRDLREGESGPDVRRLQTSLRLAGFPSTDPQGFFGWSTGLALTNLYEANGVPVPTQQSSGRTVPIATAEELAFIAHLPATIIALPVALGEQVSGPVAQVAFGEPVVRFNAPASAELRPAGVVKVSPDGASRSWVGTLVGVGALKSTVNGMARDVTVRLPATFPTHLVGTKSEVRAVAKGRREGLIVPLAAVYARASGTTAVIVVGRGSRQSVGVEVVATAGGAAMVRPTVEQGLRRGDRVSLGVKP